jgi:hypothetical protein
VTRLFLHGYSSPIKAFLLWLIIAAFPPQAAAVLGSPASSIVNDGTATVSSPGALNGLGGANAAFNVTVQSVTTDSGVTLNEYVFANQVFAVSWGGPVIPDFSSLLGSSFAAFQQAAQSRPPGGRNAPLVVETAQVVVHLSGHMRAFKGLAYLPAAVPAGFAIGNLEP